MSTNKNKKNIIEISQLNKWYGEFHALKNIDLKV
ncbi:MAG: amino acid ABC transporter ATP-binding protein, partial [Thiotrichales bacterium]|nr:amino acid ABC transporter ATP-binding protein [Thiotrichales bacterium]